MDHISNEESKGSGDGGGKTTTTLRMREKGRSGTETFPTFRAPSAIFAHDV